MSQPQATASPQATPSPRAAPSQVAHRQDGEEYPNNPVTQMYLSFQRDSMSKVVEENQALKEINAHLMAQHDALMSQLPNIQGRLHALESFIYQMFPMGPPAPLIPHQYPSHQHPAGNYQPQSQPGVNVTGRPKTTQTSGN